MSRAFAFSTLGCPGASIDEIVGIARDSGCSAVELRVSDEEHVRIGLTATQRAAVRSALAGAGIDIVCLAGYVRAGGAEITDRECADALLRHLELAADLGADGIRVFPGATDSTADEPMCHRLSAVADRYADADVALLLETHDSHRAGRDAARVLGRVAHPAVGAVWDVLHTWLAGESPIESGRALAPYLRHVQVKDVASTADLTPVGLGRGVLPLRGVLAALDGLDYRGPVSLEWERRWYPHADPLGVALTAAREWLSSTGTDDR